MGGNRAESIRFLESLVHVVNIDTRTMAEINIQAGDTTESLHAQPAPPLTTALIELQGPPEEDR